MKTNIKYFKLHYERSAQLKSQSICRLYEVSCIYLYGSQVITGNVNVKKSELCICWKFSVISKETKVSWILFFKAITEANTIRPQQFFFSIDVFIMCLILHFDSSHIIHLRSHKNIANRTMFQRSVLNNSQNGVVQWDNRAQMQQHKSRIRLFLVPVV